MNHHNRMNKPLQQRCLSWGCVTQKPAPRYSLPRRKPTVFRCVKQQTYYQNSQHLNRTSSRTIHATNETYQKQSAYTLPILKNLRHKKNNNADELLKKKTQAWLDTPVGSWTRKDIALGRSLMEDWLRLPSANPKRAPWAQRILSRWIQERLHNNQSISLFLSSELLDMLHRVLYAWRMRIIAASEQGYHLSDNANAFEESQVLLDQMEQLYQATKVERLRPGDKAYSMVLQTLALSTTQNPDAGGKAYNLLQQCLNRRRENDPDIIILNSCLHVYAKQSPYQSDAPEQAEKLLEQMMTGAMSTRTVQVNLPQPDVTSFASVLQAWANSPRTEAAKRAQAILERMLQQRDPSIPLPNTACFNICIDAHARSTETGAAQRAQDLLERTLNTTSPIHVQPDHISFLSAMNAWAKCEDDPKAAEKAEALLAQMQLLYEEMGNPRICPTAPCYAVVLDAWARRQDSGPKVEALLEQMEEKLTSAQTNNERNEDNMHLHPQGSSVKAGYLAAIRAWGNTTSMPEAPELAEALLHKMEEQSAFASTDVHELAPCIKTYSAVIGAWAKSPRKDAAHRALALLRSLQHKNSIDEPRHVAPNTVLFNNVLNAFARKGDADSAMALLKEMKTLFDNGNRNVQPDNVSYSTVIHALARSPHTPRAAEQASELLEELIDCHIQDGSESMKPTAYTFSSVILAWSNSNRSDCGEQAEDVLWRMVELAESEENAVKPNVIVCNAVLRAWSRSMEGAAPERAEAILEWMDDQVKSGRNQAVSPNRNTLTYVLQIWAQSRRASSIRHIEQHLARMVRESKNNPGHPMFPTDLSYNCLLEAIQKSRLPDKARKCQLVLEQLLGQSSETGSVKLWNLHSFHIVFMACLHTTVTGEESCILVRDVLHATFQHLKTTNLIVPDRMIVLLLRAYANVGSPDSTFVFDVFHFCHSKEINTKSVLGSLRKTLSQRVYKAFGVTEEKARKGITQ